MNDTIIKSKRISSQDLGMPKEFFTGYVKNTKKFTWVRVYKNGACIDAFNCETSKIDEAVKSKYGNDVTYKI